MIISKQKFLSRIILFLIISNITLFAQLTDISNQCDYLIITPSQFVSPLERFVEWRQAKGFIVQVVEVEQIYSEFPDSGKSYSIRDFVSYALTNWSDPKPKYLLLVGGVELLPPFRVKSSFANLPDHNEDSVSIDHWYSVNKFDSDVIADINIGRFPVNDDEELNNIISKTIAFEDTLSFEDYSNDFLILTDKADSNFFEGAANSFIDSYLPTNYSKLTIFAGQDSTIETTRKSLFNGLSEGTLFLNYYGHGKPSAWSQYKIFSVNDIDSLSTNELPFIYSAAACSQSFDLPEDSSIVKNLIVLPKTGTVASIASTGLMYSAVGNLVVGNFYRSLLSDPEITIGEAVRQAKHLTSSTAQRYTLLGDPALKIPNNIVAQIAEKPDVIKHTYSLKQNYPNPFNPSTTIEYSIPQKSFVSIIVYNLLGQEISALVQEIKQAGNYSIQFNGENLTSGVYICRLTCNNFVQSKKLVLIK